LSPEAAHPLNVVQRPCLQLSCISGAGKPAGSIFSLPFRSTNSLQRGASACIQRNRYANGTPQGLRSSGKLGHRHLLDRAISTAAPTHTSSTLASISTCGSPSVAAPVIDLSRRFSGLESSSGFKFAQPGSLAKERVANGPQSLASQSRTDPFLCTAFFSIYVGYRRRRNFPRPGVPNEMRRRAAMES
jgi:hypothetical protein